MEKHGYDYPYRESSHLLQAADITAAIWRRLSRTGERRKRIRNMYTEARQRRFLPSEAGFDVLSLANNHTLDYGLVGLQDTMAALDEHGLSTWVRATTKRRRIAPAICGDQRLQGRFHRRQ